MGKQLGITKEQAASWVGGMVKCFGRKGFAHGIPGKVLGYDDENVIVQLPGHGKPEEYPLSKVILWKSHSPEQVARSIPKISPAGALKIIAGSDTSANPRAMASLGSPGAPNFFKRRVDDDALGPIHLDPTLQPTTIEPERVLNPQLDGLLQNAAYLQNLAIAQLRDVVEKLKVAA